MGFLGDLFRCLLFPTQDKVGEVFREGLPENKESGELPERDHLYPKTEGGGNESYNYPYFIPQSENRSKGARLPFPDEFIKSSNPFLVMRDIGRDSEKGFRNSRNKDRGFWGIPRPRLW